MQLFANIHTMQNEKGAGSDTRGNEAVGASRLSEGEISGASSEGRKPTTLTTDELRFWLECRGEPAKGLKTKAQLPKR